MASCIYFFLYFEYNYKKYFIDETSLETISLPGLFIQLALFHTGFVGLPHNSWATPSVIPPCQSKKSTLQHSNQLCDRFYVSVVNKPVFKMG